MSEVKQIVLDWIGRNFNLTQVTLSDFPKVPGGTMVTDKLNGSKTLVCWDYLNNQIIYGEPMKKKKHSYPYGL